jgi:uncharacterized protein involved in exopolysaccharide biosynthesis
LAAKRALLGRRTARHDELDSQRESALAAYETVLKRTEEIKSGVGYRGERLKILDKGIVPERPSAPNIPLHVLSALLLALSLSIGYLTFDFSRARRRPAPFAVPIRGTGTLGDD